MAKFCPECGNPITEPNSQFCNKCGTKFIQSPPEKRDNVCPPSKTTPSDALEAAITRHTGKIVVGSFIFFLLLLLIVGFFMSPANIGNTGIVITGNSAGVGASKPSPILSVAEIKSQAINVSYDDLFRNNEKYIGKTVYYRGRIVQVLPVSGDNYEIRVATKQSVYSGYSGDIVNFNYKGSRFLEGDIIDVWGNVGGLDTYKTIQGGSNTEPKLTALHTELVKKASD